MIRLLAAIAISACLAGAASAQALTLQPVGTFNEPIFVTSDPGNPDRLFVVERKGRIVESENGAVSVFADIRSIVGCGGECGGERGLLSIALAPDFASSSRLYVFYAEDEGTGAIHVAEMRANGTFAPASSLRNLLTIEHPEDSNHYGGQLQFGPEGDLFISTGDGGGADDEHENAQDLGSLLGKILRIDPNPSGLAPYTVPVGNPFVGVAGAEPEIWAYGLRNPFRFSFDRETGAMLIGDVGQNAWEEVDYAPAPGIGAGANYGWNCKEGFAPGPATDPGCGTAVLTDPVFAYPNPEAGCAAVIGGYVVRDQSLGGLYGRYLYGDLCSGQVRSFSLPPASPAVSDRPEGIEIANLNSFGEDSCGRLYVVSGDGLVARLVGATAATCAPLPAPLAYSFAGIRAKSRAVKKNKRALISVWVAPCAGRRGQPINLYRGRHRIGTRHLDRVCTARFRPRISRRGKFRARIKSDGKYIEATSRKILIRPRHHRFKRHSH